MSFSSLKSGFTFLELSIVIGITLILTTIATVSVGSLQHKTYLGTTVTTTISDIKQQQLKAMLGDTEGRGFRSTYGIHFFSDRYELFYNTYSVATKIYTVQLNPSVTFSIVNLPSSEIVFSEINGDITGYSSAQNTVILRDTINNQQKTIQLNRYGVITQVN